MFVADYGYEGPEGIEEYTKELRKALEIDYEVLREEFINDPELQ